MTPLGTLNLRGSNQSLLVYEFQFAPDRLDRRVRRIQSPLLMICNI